jgi:hypothetical protein
LPVTHGDRISESRKINELPVEAQAFFALLVGKATRTGCFPADLHQLSLRLYGRRSGRVRLARMLSALRLAGLVVPASRPGWLQVPNLRYWARPDKRAAIPLPVRMAVFARDGGRCRRCGWTEDIQFDHVIPYSTGGGDEANNLQLLCGPCNREKGVTG